MRILHALCAGLTLVTTAAELRAQADTYYVIVFGGQPPGFKSPKRSHTWATFIHLCPDGRAEEFTISWLPQTGQVRPLALRPEPGRNYGLHETVDFCRKNGMEMRAWGPYQMEPMLWNLAVAHKDRLDSSVQYKANDMGARDMRISNCIHAVAAMMREPGQRAPIVKTAPVDWGESGSYWTTLALAPYFIDPCCVHYDVMRRLGLCQDEFLRGSLDRNPTRNPITRHAQAVLQSYLLPNRVKCP